MPSRVGVDLASVSAVADSVSAHGSAYLSRVYTEDEVRDCGGDPARLAARFAAKEATLKVLRTGATAVPWRDIEVVRDPTGYPELRLTGAAADLAGSQGLSGFAVSLTHEDPHACAVVVADVKGPGAGADEP